MPPSAPLDPKALFHWLAGCPAENEVCIECGAGFGEVSAALSPFFKTTIATDIAPPEQKSPYGVRIVPAPAEQIPASDGSVDLLVSMQALHFFELPDHLAEARRVLRSGGIYAAFCWGPMILPEQIARAYRRTIGALAPYWEAERGWVLAGYRGVPVAGTAIDMPSARLTRQMTLPALDARIARWSAMQNALRAGASIAEPHLETLTLSDEDSFDVSWPILGQVFRV